MRAALLCALVFAGAAALAQGASQPPPKQKPVASATTQSAATDDRGTQQTPLIVEVKAMPERTQEERAEQAAERRDKADTDRWMLRLTAVLAVATAALVVATGFLWWATQRLVAQASNSSERQLRAYINVFNASAEWEDEEGVLLRVARVTVKSRNSGQTPAYKVTCWASVKSAEPGCTEFPDPERSPGSVEVNGPGHIGRFILSYQTPFLAKEDEVDIWARGDRSLFVYGEIRYEDAFGKPQYTKFRLVMPPDGVGKGGGIFRACAEGNEAT